jgi:hypothetical protein
MQIQEAGKRLASAGVELSRVTKEAFLAAKQRINPLLLKAGIEAGWTSGGAGSFDPGHPYPGTLRQDSGDIDIMIDPQELLQKFPADIEEWNQTSDKPLGPKALANAFADPAKKAKLQMSASKAALANYMTKNGMSTDSGTLTVHYVDGGKNYSIDLIVRPRSAWPLHTHDFSLDPGMRGGDLWNELYPTLAKLASQSTVTDPKTGEEKGNLQFSPDHGLVDRNTKQIVARGDEKDKIAKILISPEVTARDISSLTGIKTALQKYAPEKWELVKHLYPAPAVQEGSREWFRFLMDHIL